MRGHLINQMWIYTSTTLLLNGQTAMCISVAVRTHRAIACRVFQAPSTFGD
jgi:hypothetical protein